MRMVFRKVPIGRLYGIPIFLGALLLILTNTKNLINSVPRAKKGERQ